MLIVPSSMTIWAAYSPSILDCNPPQAAFMQPASSKQNCFSCTWLCSQLAVPCRQQLARLQPTTRMHWGGEGP